MALMNCPSCGREISDTADTCPGCGHVFVSASPNEFYSYGTPVCNESSKGNGQAVAALVLGLVGLFAWLLPLFGFPVTIVGIVMGATSLKSQRHGMALAGLILSCVFLLLTLANSVMGALIFSGVMSSL